MRLILLDTNRPHGMRTLLSGCDVRTAHQMGWDKLTNEALLAAAESVGFVAMISADRNMRYQQNLSGRKIALIELSTSHWETIRDNIQPILDAVDDVAQGSYATVPLPLPPKRRRPYPPPI